MLERPLDKVPAHRLLTLRVVRYTLTVGLGNSWSPAESGQKVSLADWQHSESVSVSPASLPASLILCGFWKAKFKSWFKFNWGAFDLTIKRQLVDG